MSTHPLLVDSCCPRLADVHEVAPDKVFDIIRTIEQSELPIVLWDRDVAPRLAGTNLQPRTLHDGSRDRWPEFADTIRVFFAPADGYGAGYTVAAAVWKRAHARWYWKFEATAGALSRAIRENS